METIFNSLEISSLSGHFAYSLIFLSFVVRKMLLLRSFAIFASLSSIYFNYTLSSGPQWIPIKWNAVFISINIFHLAMFFLSKRSITISKTEESVYSKNFSALTKVEFKRLLKVGFTRTYSSGTILIEENQNLEALFLIMEGETKVMIKNLEVAQLFTGDFIGEMSFLTEQKTKAKVVTSKESKIHFWEKEELKAFLQKNPILLAKLHGAIGNQLITKLISKSLREAQDQELQKVA
jgi:CRP-like cAMP-binding protein